MSEQIALAAEWCAATVETIGIVVITAVALYVIAFAAAGLLRRQEPEHVYQQVRQRLGRGIILGLEFLVAADIIHTVAVELTFSTVGTLAIIVAIRTVLSLTLEVELNGRWPWQSGA